MDEKKNVVSANIRWKGMRMRRMNVITRKGKRNNRLSGRRRGIEARGARIERGGER